MIEPTLEQASALLKSKNFRQAANLYTDLIQLYPENALAYQGLATCFLETGQYEEAYNASRKALEINSGLSVPHRILANIHWSKKELDASEQELRKAILKEPNASDLYLSLGGLLVSTKRTEESISIFQKAIELDSTNWLTYYRLSSAYLRLSNHKEALNELRRAYRLKQSFEISFALISTFMALNWLWLFPLLLVVFFTSFILPTLVSLPLVFIIAGLQVATSSAYFIQRDVKSGIINLVLFFIYISAWIYLKL